LALLPVGAVSTTASSVPAASGIGATTSVDRHRDFTVPDKPSGKSLTPLGAQLTETGTSNFGMSDYTVSFSATPALPTRQLVYGFWVQKQGGYTLRVDAQVVWRPRMPAAATVAAHAAEVDVTKQGAQSVSRVTASAKVAALIRLVNSLEMSPRGARSCAADRAGTTLTLSFLPTIGAHDPYAVVTLDGSGCESGTVTQIPPTGARTTVRGLDATGIAQRVAALVGLRLGTS
jgi:hypothetical protein